MEVDNIAFNDIASRPARPKRIISGADIIQATLEIKDETGRIICNPATSPNSSTSYVSPSGVGAKIDARLLVNNVRFSASSAKLCGSRTP